MEPVVIRYRRFSTDEQGQSNKDSLTRQEKVCAAFAQEQGWTISLAGSFDDPGLSAYKNHHIEIGNLGKFTARVMADEVAKGTVLLVENLDRLSRRPFAEANLFAGMTVCGVCGNRAFLSTNEKKGRAYRYLRCEGAREGRGCANNGYFPYSAFEDTALDLCLDLALDDRFFEATGELKKLRVLKAETEKVIADKGNARLRLLSMFEDGDDQVLERLGLLKSEIDGLTTALATVDQDLARASGKVGDIEHLRRVNDIREAAKSDNPDVQEQARAKLQRAMAAIVNSVSVDWEWTEWGDEPGAVLSHGPKCFTLALAGGVLGVRINTKGEVLASVHDAAGRPLYEHLDDADREMLAPLIRRIEARAIGAAA